MTSTDTNLAADYEALRRGVGAYWLPRDFLTLSGPDAAAYLQGQCSQEVVALGVGQSADALLLAPEGKIDALIRVTRAGPDEFILDTEAGFGEVVAARLARFKLRSKLDIESRDWSCLALRGLGLPTQPGDRHDLGRAGHVVGVEWNGWGGFDLLGEEPQSALPPDAQWCGAAAWEACRVESGIPVMGRELDAKTIAAEAGLVERTVSFTKGCFTGQELVARLDARGNKVARRLCGVVAAEGAVSDPEQFQGAELVGDGEKVLGSITSVAWCPGVGAIAALSYVHRSFAVPGALQVRLADGSTLVGAEVRPLPLAPIR